MRPTREQMLVDREVERAFSDYRTPDALKETETTHRWWKTQFLPLARDEVKARQDAGEYASFPESAAEIMASYAATDMMLVGRTLLLPMPDVLPDDLPVVADRRAA